MEMGDKAYKILKLVIRLQSPCKNQYVFSPLFNPLRIWRLGICNLLTCRCIGDLRNNNNNRRSALSIMSAPEH